jgi:8-oxo-dGTP pyrophosphatase MutT (NUDIX family)
MTQGGQGKHRPRVVETSAGGFVLNAENPKLVALIGRYTRGGRLEWCIPKGHPEGDENYEQAAVREVGEETGLIAEIVESLGQITYEFTVPDRTIEKTVHHFILRQTGGELTVENDPDQEAVEARWYHIDELENQLTHKNEKNLARKLIEWLEKQ